MVFFVRAGNHSESARALSAAKMGETYGCREDNTPLVAAVSQKSNEQYVGSKDFEAVKSSIISEFQGKINQLTQAIANISLISSAQNLPTNKSPTVHNRHPRQRFKSDNRNTVGNGLCRKFNALGHFARTCNWNEQGYINNDSTCRHCGQNGHLIQQCIRNERNQGNPGNQWHDPRGEQK